MRKIALIITALLLALTIAGTLSAQVFADSITESTPPAIADGVFV